MLVAARAANRILTHAVRSPLREKSGPIAAIHLTADQDHQAQLSSFKDRNHEEETVSTKQPVFSNCISFASPESDFTNPHLHNIIKSQFTHGVDLENEEDEKQEDNSTSYDVYSFSSPEGDFNFSHEKDTNLKKSSYDTNEKWSHSLSFSSPESDFSTNSFPSSSSKSNQKSFVNQEYQNVEEAKRTFFQQHLDTNSINRNGTTYSLSFASAENDFCNPELLEMLSERQKKQLDNTSLLATLPNQNDSNQFSSMSMTAAASHRHHHHEAQAEEIPTVTAETKNLEYKELRAHADLLRHEEPLPMNMQGATMEDDARAIVITETEAPFRIVDVNSAWENLCGFSKHECNGKTLRCIQGAETNQGAVTALMSQLLRGEEAGTLLVNYRKDGSKFLNRLRVGAMRDDHDTVTHFVAVLKEVKEMEDQFNNSSARILA